MYFSSFKIISQGDEPITDWSKSFQTKSQNKTIYITNYQKKLLI